MIIHYNKTTGTIYGTSNGFEINRLHIRPIDVPCEEVDQIVLSKEFMKKKPSLIGKIGQHKVVKSASGEIIFKFVGGPKLEKSATKTIRPESFVDQVISGLENRLSDIIEKKVEESLAEQKENSKEKA